MSKQTEKQKPSEGKAPEGEKNQLALIKRDYVDVVADKVHSMVQRDELHLPDNYSVGNALAAWWLALQDCQDKDKRKALDVCTPNSIANATLYMVVQGLSPQKSQCYPIVYGRSLVCQRSYFGTIAVLKRIYGQDVETTAEVVYEGDEFEYEILCGRKRVTKHTQKLANIKSDKILAAYGTVQAPGREPVTVVMTLEEIQRAWQQGQTKGQSPAHKGFPAEMCKKTVLGRASKVLINTADDANLIVRHAKAQDQVIAEAELEAEMEGQADGELLALEGDGNPESEEEGEVIDLTPEEEEFEAAMEDEEAAEDKSGKGAQASLDTDPGF